MATEPRIVSGAVFSAEELGKLCYQLATVAYPNGAPWRQATFIADVDMPQAHYDVILVRERPVGFISHTVVLDEAEVTNVAVHPDFQHQGLAGRLLNGCFEQLSPGDQLFLEVRSSNVAAQHLYLKCGFERIATRKNYYHSPLEDALIMRKIIN
ncbi:ribosomal protein S18-alanine N-acetyltransferase [Lactiplantibacillus plajomi]|uniref:[Ribosomal protein bS18]-alanine N-acetyltransferase n=1 Tax=Lactiplantibacillus plajomi TaxID=1457217 RepID=A0ABV6K3D9_9LACO|nr:ribosomal protein S18-alanine N-acetyltransferase [Lactiplantibacillus plajomi]